MDKQVKNMLFHYNPTTGMIKVPFGQSPVSFSYQALLSYYVRILFWMLQLGVKVRVRGFLS